MQVKTVHAEEPLTWTKCGQWYFLAFLRHFKASGLLWCYRERRNSSPSLRLPKMQKALTSWGSKCSASIKIMFSNCISLHPKFKYFPDRVPDSLALPDFTPITGRTVTSNGSPYATGPLSWVSRLSVTLVYCSRTVKRIKMPLGTEVGLGPGDIMLDRDPVLPPHGKGKVSK